MKLKQYKKPKYSKPKIFTKKIRINYLWENNPINSGGELLAGCWGGNSDWWSYCGF